MADTTARKSRRAEALEFAKSLRRDVLDEKKSLSILLLQCRTICKYLDRMSENEWIELELDGYYGKYQTNKELTDNLPPYRKVGPIFFGHSGRMLPLPYSVIEPFAKNMALGVPISQIENSKVYSITSGALLDELNKYLNKLLEKERMDERNVVYYAQFGENHLKTVTGGLRKRIADFADDVILELEYGEIPEQIFEALRTEVDQKLATLTPQTIEKLKNAYEKIATSDSSEDWSHVASTCRRVIKDVANVVFPAQDTPQKDKDGKEHIVDDGHVINRIVAGISADLGKGKNRIFTESMIEYIGNFLKGIQEYASKGDHALFQKTDAVRCVVYTYLLLGDILNYHVDKDERNVGEVKTTENEPDITIVNFNPEYAGSNNTPTLFPNFRNDGIAARNIKIHYKLIDKFVDLREIIAQEVAIKKSVISVPGTLRHGESVNLNDGKDGSGIAFPNTGWSGSVILWFNYEYGDNQTGEVVLDLRYQGIRPFAKQPLRYTKGDIQRTEDVS